MGIMVARMDNNRDPNLETSRELKSPGLITKSYFVQVISPFLFIHFFYMQ